MSARIIGYFVAVFVALGFFAAMPGAVASTNDWHVASVLALGIDDVSISCPSTNACWALEAGELLQSPDGGTTWNTRTALVPTGVAALNDLACRPRGRCYVTAVTDAGAPEVLTIAGGSVTASTGPGSGKLRTIACPGRLHCFVSDGVTVWSTRNGGATWTPHALPAIVYSNAALGCVPRTSRCWIVGNNGENPLIERTLTGGDTWRLQNAPSPTDSLYDVACPTKIRCYAVGSDISDHAIVISTTDTGVNWTFGSLPLQNYALRSVSCPRPRHCRAVGRSPAYTPFVDATADGQAWSPQPVPAVSAAQPAHIACMSTTQCAAVEPGTAFAASHDTWASETVESALTAPAALDCPQQGTCVGAGNDASGAAYAITSSDGGATWTRHAMPPDVGTVTALACPASSACFALAYATGSGGSLVARALYSADGGVTWHRGHLDNAAGLYRMLTCPGPTTCLAGGFGNNSAARVMRTTDGGQTWQLAPTPPGFYLDGLACASLQACIAITNQPNAAPIAWTSTDLLSTYQQHSIPAADYYSAACAATTCVAVGSAAGGGLGAIATSSDGGASWTSAPTPSNAELLYKVVCGAADSCLASSFDFAANQPLVVGTTDAGASWHAFAVPARPEAPIAVGCAGQSCVASDQTAAGNPVILSGTA